MKKISLLKSIFGILAFALVFTACEVDPGTGGDPGGGGGLVTGPSISLEDEAGFLSVDASVSPDTDFSVKITGTRGDALLKALFVQEDFLDLDPSRFLINGAPSAANPRLILAPDNEGFTWELTIRSQDAADTRNYNFIIEDESGEMTSTSINITATGGNPPVVTIGGSGMFTADAGGLISLPLTAEAGSFELSSVSVFENGELMQDFADRLYYDDLNNAFDSNPYALPEEDRMSLDRTLFIRASDTPGVSTYRVVLTDEFGNSTPTEFTIDTGIAGTDVTTLTGVLFNRAGPAGTGGLDLDTGDGTGSSDPAAEIRDEGINGDNIDVNWIKTITGVNGTDLRSLFPGLNGLSEFFTFADIEKKEQIEGFWDSSFIFENTNADGNLTSFEVEVGDMFIALNGGQYYTFIVREVNETADNNDDNYVVDIKF